MRRLECTLDDEAYRMALEDAGRKGISIQDWIVLAAREFLKREHFRIQETGIGDAAGFHVEKVNPVRGTREGEVITPDRPVRVPAGGSPGGEDGESEICIAPALLRFELEIERAGMELDSMESELERLKIERERISTQPGTAAAAERLSGEIEQKSYEIENFQKELDLLLTKRDEERARRSRRSRPDSA